MDNKEVFDQIFGILKMHADVNNSASEAINALNEAVQYLLDKNEELEKRIKALESRN